MAYVAHCQSTITARKWVAIPNPIRAPHAMPSTVEDRLKDLGIVLPKPAAPVATYVPFVIDGHHLIISGQLPFVDGKLAQTGKLGAGVSVEQGAAAARISAINILAQVKAALGSLDRVRQLVRILAFVASAPDFTQQPPVVNGASNLFVEVFGERGKHTRTSVGAAALPLDASVEIEALFSFE